MGSTSTPVAYWNVNMPESEWTEECPAFLANLNTKDLGIISTPDSEYHVETWPEVVKKCKDNRLDLFQRVPSDLRRYFAYNWKLKQEYGSVMNFVLSQRLGWEVPIVPKGKPFEFEEDIKVLWNDWPYGIDERIVHLVVWTKFDLEEDPSNGDLTDKARAEIEEYVDKLFSPHLPKDHYVWFKNWASLKSVRAVEHFHVMLFDPAPAIISKLTNGDVPLSQKVGKLN